MREAIKILGRLIVSEIDPETGIARIVSVSDNTIMTAGRKLVAQLFGGGAVALPTYLAVGTGSTAVAASQTALVTEILRGAVTSRSYSDDTASLAYTVPSGTGVGNTFQEAGLFNAASGGTMFNRVLLTTAYTKTATNLPIFTFDLDFDP